MNSKQLTRAAFHALAFFLYLIAIVRFELMPHMPHLQVHERFAGRLKYLTYWNVWIQFCYFALSVFIDIQISSSRNYMRLIRFRDKMFAGLAVPFGVFVFAMFWILVSINRELVFPKVLDSIFPWWLNHLVHTVIFPVLLVEAWLLKHKYPRRKDGLGLTMLLCFAYFVWVLFLGVYMDIWVYPLLKMLSWAFRVLFFAICALLLSLSYLFGEKLTSAIWG